MRPFMLNIRGDLRLYQRPCVMGIINATPDSFYEQSRATSSDDVKKRVEELVTQGADFIDVGAYSTRPGCEDVSMDLELRRLDTAMEALRTVAPDIPVSVDTFRAEVARKAITEMSADIINDISGGNLDSEMMPLAAELHVPYIAMHMRGTPQTKADYTEYDNLLPEVLRDMAEKVNQLNLLGVNDIIIDPGIGFSKDVEQNYILLRHLDLFDIFHTPILVGISRKSMITEVLNVSAEEALNGTTALHMAALQKGASILRVHDVKQAVETIRIYNQMQEA